MSILAYPYWHYTPWYPQPPTPSARIRVAAFIDRDTGLDSPIAMHFARAPYVALIDIENGRIVGLQVVKNPVYEEAIDVGGYGGPGGAGRGWGRGGRGRGGHGFGRRIVEFLVSQGVRAVIAGYLGPGASTLLQQMGIAIHIVAPGTPLRDALRVIGLAY